MLFESTPGSRAGGLESVAGLSPVHMGGGSKHIVLRPSGAAPMIFGHRGVSTRAPENTLSAFSLIATEGIPGVELDVRQCASGDLVVAHDASLARTSGVELRLRDATLAVIREHDVGAWFNSEFIGERVPTLSEVFQLLGRRVTYDIEIKPYGLRRGTSLESSLYGLIRRYGLADRCFVSSFDSRIVRRFARLSRDIPTALNYSNFRKSTLLRWGLGRLLFNSDILKPHYSLINDQFVRRHHQLGYQIVPWTIDDPSLARSVSEAGVDGLISNAPDVIRSEIA